MDGWCFLDDFLEVETWRGITERYNAGKTGFYVFWIFLLLEASLRKNFEILDRNRGPWYMCKRIFDEIE